MPDEQARLVRLLTTISNLWAGTYLGHRGECRTLSDLQVHAPPWFSHARADAAAIRSDQRTGLRAAWIELVVVRTLGYEDAMGRLRRA